MSGASPPDVSAALAALAREQGVRILFAAESGSRAWGFDALLLRWAGPSI